MSILINTDLIKFYFDNYDIDDVVFNGESLQSLVIDGAKLFTNIFTYTLTADGTYAIGLADKDKSYSETITIPNTHKGIPVTKIADWGFSETPISKILFPANSNITTIGAHAFDCCTGLTSIELPKSLQTIEEYAFADCSSLTSISIPDNVTRLEQACFRACKELSNISLNNKLDFIDAYAFQDCSALTKVVIPDSVTTIGAGAFSGCYALADITVPFIGYTSDPDADLATKQVFGYIFGTTDYSGGTLTNQVYNLSGSSVSYYIPTSLKTVTVTGGDIPIGAFYNCTNLSTITLPSTATAIKGYAFYNCNKLTKLNIPIGITNIDLFAFDACTSLTDITIPETVTTIGNKAFRDCTNISHISIPASVTTIGTEILAGCSKLSSIIIPFIGASKTATAGNALFGYLFGTASYTGSTSTKQQHASGTTTYYIPSTLRSVELLPGCGNIGYGAFSCCANISDVVLPNEEIAIEEKAFYKCANLLTIRGLDHVSNIGDYAFAECTTLTAMLNLDFLISIGKGAFYYCTSLTKVGLEYNQELAYIDDDAFSYCAALTNIFIPFGTTSIGSSAFKSAGLTSITLPDSVTSIGEQAFNACFKLSQIVIPNSLTTIKKQTFQSCTSLTAVTIPDSVTTIESQAFTLCTALSTLNITHKAWTIDTTAYSFNTAAEMLSALTANNTGAKIWTKYDIVAPTFGATLSGKSSITITVSNSNSIPLDIGGQVVYYLADGTSAQQALSSYVPANGTAQTKVACFDREAVEISFSTAKITVWFRANSTLVTEKVMLSSGWIQGEDSSTG